MTAITVTTHNDLLTDLAEKIGETAIASTDVRKRMINSAYQFIANKELWWWLETSTTDTTTTATDYALPSTFRAFHPRNPVKIASAWRNLVPFENLQIYDGTTSVVGLPMLVSNRLAYIYGSRIYFIQDSMSAGQTITYYFYRTITPLDATSDEPLMPVSFREMISLYAAGMYLQSQGGVEAEEGKTYLELFDTYLQDMKSEQDNRRTMGIKRRSLDPEEGNVFGNSF